MDQFDMSEDLTQELKEMPKTPTIGIHLGETNSCVAVYVNGEVEIIANEYGNRIPSYAICQNSKCIIGEAALDFVMKDSTNFVYDNMTLIIIRNFATMVRWPFEIIDSNGEPKILITKEGELKEFFPRQILAIVFMQMKKIAEIYLGAKVKDALITVPVYLNSSERQATIVAGKIAGLNVKKISNESSVAAAAYHYQKKIRDNKNILIFNMGLKTCHVSIVKYIDNKFKLIASGGKNTLGDIHFSYVMLNHFVEEIKQVYKTDDILENKSCFNRLLDACQTAKCHLSYCNEASIDIESFFKGFDFHAKITRAVFNDLCNLLHNRIIQIIKNVLKKAELENMNIDEIILLGFSTKFL